ncbi:MAG TPA: response regulator [Verrucomicrobiota bacterium]|nr:response regulator [Verrucomicrobiota bacterium]HRZ36957.1 response regulator [Candidatus Paceibacterota bacterium]HRZ54863.1 response regulator [Candidatus Paceibacterota bacterium]
MKGAKKRVLIVDDEVSFTRLLKLNLEQSDGYEVQTVNAPLTALAEARRFQPELILLDVMMPDLPGGDVAAQLLADPALRHVPIIFLTAAIKKAEVSACGGLVGGLPFVAKPVEMKELRRVLDAYLA